ncbi:MAG: RNA polymerase sigma factor [Fimbriimonadales bacterium]
MWQAAQAYQEQDGVSREAFAVLCAKRAIYEEWRRGRTRDKAVVSIPVDEETGEAVKFVDKGALEALWEGVLCSQVREALERLSEADRQLIEWYFEDGLSERAIAERLGCSHVAVHKRLHCAWARLCRALGVEQEFPGRRGKKSP